MKMRNIDNYEAESGDLAKARHPGYVSGDIQIVGGADIGALEIDMANAQNWFSSMDRLAGALNLTEPE